MTLLGHRKFQFICSLILLGKFSRLNPEGLYLSVEKENGKFCVFFTTPNSGRVSKEVSCGSRAKNVQKRRDARANVVVLLL